MFFSLSNMHVSNSVADPHLKSPSGSAWRDPDPGGKKPWNCTGSLGKFWTGSSKVRIPL